MPSPSTFKPAPVAGQRRPRLHPPHVSSALAGCSLNSVRSPCAEICANLTHNTFACETASAAAHTNRRFILRNRLSCHQVPYALAFVVAPQPSRGSAPFTATANACSNKNADSTEPALHSPHGPVPLLADAADAVIGALRCLRSPMLLGPAFDNSPCRYRLLHVRIFRTLHTGWIRLFSP